jgi:hypothetical protein
MKIEMLWVGLTVMLLILTVYLAYCNYVRSQRFIAYKKQVFIDKAIFEDAIEWVLLKDARRGSVGGYRKLAKNGFILELFQKLAPDFLSSHPEIFNSLFEQHANDIHMVRLFDELYTIAGSKYLNAEIRDERKWYIPYINNSDWEELAKATGWCRKLPELPHS